MTGYNYDQTTNESKDPHHVRLASGLEMRYGGRGNLDGRWYQVADRSTITRWWASGMRLDNEL